MSKNNIEKRSEYAVIKVENAKEIVQANLGGSGASPFDLETVHTPTAGGASWTVPALDGERTEKTLTGVIVAWQDVRAYWSGAYSGGEPPECSAEDGQHGVGDPGGECQLCPFAQWGSDDNGQGRGQACKAMRRVFLLQPERLLPLLLNLAPTSLKGCRAYFVKLTSAQVPYWGVITEFGLEKRSNKNGIAYAVATFKVLRLLDAEEKQRVTEYREAIAGLLTPRKTTATGGV